ncbi:MAG: hypothetical protein ACOYBY_15245 [Dermatophilaceae bacterium]
MMQRTRRTNPYPLTWQIPLTLAIAVLLSLAIGAQVGRSLANAAAGNGWVFADRLYLFSSLGGVFAGDAGAGLTGVARPATTGKLWTCVGLVELLVIAVCVAGVKWGLDRWGPGRLRGVATRGEAEALLGLTRLRKHAKVIRPDLYGPSRGGHR